ncbi:MAG: Com family DNA-binding transcriptional regulator [Desulfovibrio sp.]|nr:Com family DNA-binding transcriptional regulator [Desulfovibrio sp.]
MGATWAGELKIVCPRCKRINHLRAVSPNPEPHDGLSRPQGGNYAPSHPAR